MRPIVAPWPAMLCDVTREPWGQAMQATGKSEALRFGGVAAPANKRARAVEGLYDLGNERDSCGIGFIVNMKNRKSQKIVQDGLRILENLEHRGAVGADPLVGDGAGMLVQIPHAFFVKEAGRLGFALPSPGAYAVGFIFMPQDAAMRAAMEKIVGEVIAEEGQVLLGWRDVPVDNSRLSKDPLVTATEPFHRQVFIGRGADVADEEAFERKLYIVRKVISARIFAAYGGLQNDFYIVSLSCRTLVYKGMFLAYQLGAYYRDLHDPDFQSALALVHQRFSTNTFPSWRLAHPLPLRLPQRRDQHGARQRQLDGGAAGFRSSPLFGDDITKLWRPYEAVDTACFDNALEFLCAAVSLPHAAMMMIGGVGGNPLMDEERRAFCSTTPRCRGTDRPQ